ncbi:hypothetical protein [Streptomyces coelicoflavus]
MTTGPHHASQRLTRHASEHLTRHASQRPTRRRSQRRITEHQHSEEYRP